MTADRADLYAVLGLTPRATQAQIRRAYRTLVRLHHPDLRPLGDLDSSVSDTTLRQAIAAYAVLGDPARRAGYDHRTAPRQGDTSTSIRVRGPRAHGNPNQPPIQAGPVRWHRTR
jgi:curved DNA-binding protein CbpA